MHEIESLQLVHSQLHSIRAEVSEKLEYKLYFFGKASMQLEMTSGLGIQPASRDVRIIGLGNVKRLILLLILLVVTACPAQCSSNALENSDSSLENSIEKEPTQQVYKHIACGTMVNNATSILITNPHHPEPTYVNTVCETVIERANATITKLRIQFRKLELYRPHSDGKCQHDRFAVYSDLNAALTPVLCGDLTGKTVEVPFSKPDMSLIISVSTSDLDHDRYWELAVDQLE